MSDASSPVTLLVKKTRPFALSFILISFVAGFVLLSDSPKHSSYLFGFSHGSCLFFFSLEFFYTLSVRLFDVSSKSRELRSSDGETGPVKGFGYLIAASLKGTVILLLFAALFVLGSNGSFLLGVPSGFVALMGVLCALFISLTIRNNS